VKRAIAGTLAKLKQRIRLSSVSLALGVSVAAAAWVSLSAADETSVRPWPATVGRVTPAAVAAGAPVHIGPYIYLLVASEAEAGALQQAAARRGVGWERAWTIVVEDEAARHETRRALESEGFIAHIVSEFDVTSPGSGHVDIAGRDGGAINR
jgi:hypothetical protein